jgi:hypothetical protein
MTITDHPLHRSGRAALPHPALALGGDGEAHMRIGMTDTWCRKPAGDVGAQAAPRQMVAVTPTAQDAPPELGHRFPERVQRGAVQRDTVVPVVPEDDGPQIRALLRDGLRQSLPEHGLHRSQLRLPPRAHRLRSTVNRPFRAFAQLCVKPRKLKVSGFPSPRARRFVSAKRPNSRSRVLSGCHVSPNRPKRSRHSARKGSRACATATYSTSTQRRKAAELSLKRKLGDSASELGTGHESVPQSQKSTCAPSFTKRPSWMFVGFCQFGPYVLL